MSNVAVAEPKQTLRDLTSELEAWKGTAEAYDDNGPDLSLIRAKIEQLESLHSDKVDRYAAFVRWLKAEQEQLKADERRLAGRRRSYETHEKSLRTNVRNVMAENEVTQFKGRASTITLSSGRQVLDVDLERLPAEYTLSVPEKIVPAHVIANEEKIKRDLKAGIEIPGASLRDGEPYITIR